MQPWSLVYDWEDAVAEQNFHVPIALGACCVRRVARVAPIVIPRPSLEWTMLCVKESTYPISFSSTSSKPVQNVI